MNDDAPRWASFSTAFSIVLSSAAERIVELGCASIGEDPKAFVDRGGLSRLESEAAEAAVKRVREAAYPLIFKLFGSELPRGKERQRVLTRLGRDLRRIETTLGYRTPPALGNGLGPTYKNAGVVPPVRKRRRRPEGRRK